MMHNLGHHLQTHIINGCSYTNKSRRAEQIQPYVKGMTSEDDDYILMAGGTNNIPDDDVIDAIIHIDDLISHTRRLRPKQRIIIPQLLHRYDTNYTQVNKKIDRVNIFLRHRGVRDPDMYFLELNSITKADLYDKLHLDYSGKEKYAQAISDLISELDSA